jgi:hypothetical protein
MALSGSFYKDVGSHWRVYCSWSATQSISGNYSDVTMYVYWQGRDQYGTTYTSTTKNGSSTVDGTTENFTFSAKLSGAESKHVKTQTKRVYHGSDGSKSFSMSASLSIELTLSGTYYGTVTASSGTVWLNTIPRASSISSAISWTAGTQNLSVTINRADGGFTHDLHMYVQRPSDNSWQWVAQRLGVGDKATFDFSVQENTNIYNNIAQYENRPVKITCTTKSGSTTIGSSTEKTGTVYGAGIAKISFSNFNIGDSISATVSGMHGNAGFEYSGKLVFGSFNKPFSFSASTPNVTLTFTPQEVQSMFAQVSTANSGVGTFYVYSRYNGVEINDGLPAPTYDPKHNFTAYVTNSNPTFNIGSISYKDVTSATVTLTGNDQYIVQNKSSLTAYVNTAATAKNGASFVKYLITVDGKQKELTSLTGNVNIGTIGASSDQTLTISAIDSRGNQTSLTLTVKVLPYAEPTMSISADRLNKFENHTTLKTSGGLSRLIVGETQKNTIKSLVFRYREKGTTSWTTDDPIAFSVSGGSFTGVNEILQLLNTKAWEFEIVVTDNLTSKTYKIEVGTGQPIMFIDSERKSVGVGMFPTLNNAFQVTGDMTLSGSVIGDFKVTGKVTATDMVASGYVGGTKFVSSQAGSVFKADGQISSANTDGGALRIEGYNNLVQIGTGNTNNDRNAYIQSRHLDSNFSTAYGTLSLNPLGGAVKFGGDLELSATSKIKFPVNAFGGSGDSAEIFLRKWGGTEDQELVIDIQNDANDRVYITSRLMVEDSVTTNWSYNGATIELGATYPYIDFKDNGEDYDMRLIQRSNNLYIEGGSLTVQGHVYVKDSLRLVPEGYQYGASGSLWYGNGYAGAGFYAYNASGWVKW